MTGIADFYLYMKRPYSRDRRRRFLAHFRTNKNGDQDEPTRFVLLSWKRTGSNLLCGILHLHPEIIMHNELFNPIDIFTYHPAVFRGTDDGQSYVPPRTPRGQFSHEISFQKISSNTSGLGRTLTAAVTISQQQQRKSNLAARWWASSRFPSIGRTSATMPSFNERSWRT